MEMHGLREGMTFRRPKVPDPTSSHHRLFLAGVCIAALVFGFPGVRTLRPAIRRAESAKPPVSARELMREVVHNELRGSNGPPTYWRYREIDKSNATEKLYEVYETKDGTVRVLIRVNGKPLPPAQQAQQQARLQAILQNPSIARQDAKARSHDTNKEERLFAMLPKAFFFQYDGTEGNLVRLTFWPDPAFAPPTREAQVFHHMAGQVLIDPRAKRLVAINGRLITEVRFFWGLLGHLDKGGTFAVRRADVGGGNWKLVRLKVNMHGVALFFKTIGVQENRWYEDYRQDPSSMTVQQAVAQLEQTFHSANAAPKSGGASLSR